ncbi:hypothetical protein ElyMa_005457900 [Elysia marginata]|uniref:DUF19 domain-containing protein n=1 Tax=Elysia marginata TaxID=1093978 RepID=A0AAV4EP30_9GAST|nr:hypothetical protein ElyMa_005457900 [Elysia marginata]
MWKLAVFLLCLLFILEVKGDCSSLLACENQLSNSAILSGDPASYAAYADGSAVLDAACGELSGLTTCVSNNLDSCTEVSIKNEIKALKDFVEYICSDDGRQDILDLADSQCNDHPNLELHMEMMMHGCLEDFQMSVQMAQFQAIMDGREFQVSEVCPFTEELEACIVNRSAAMCGPAWGTFMTNIWHIAASDQFAQFGCVHDTDHRRKSTPGDHSLLWTRNFSHQDNGSYDSK